MDQTRPAELPRPATQARRRASHLEIRQALKVQQQSFRSLSSYYSYEADQQAYTVLVAT